MKPFDIAAEDTEVAYPFDMIGMEFNLICANERTRCLFFNVRDDYAPKKWVYVYELAMVTSPRGLGGKQFEHFSKKAVLNPKPHDIVGLPVTVEEADIPDFEGFAFKDVETMKTVVLVGTFFYEGLNKFQTMFEIYPQNIPLLCGVAVELDTESCEL